MPPMYLQIPRRAFGLILLILLSFPLTNVTAWASPVAAPALEATTDLSAEARQAALIINGLRINAGLPALAVHPLLNLAATSHIHDMVTSGVYGHSGSDGSNVHQRIARTGYSIAGWAGENWAVSDTVAQSIQWWMTDPPHRDNVLGRGYKEMGVGVYPHPKGWGLILVVDFTTGSHNQESGVVLVPETADAPMPSVAVTSAPSAIPPEGMRYTVQSGDTLSGIGARYGLSWQALANANGLGEFSVLGLGQVIVLPGVASAQQASPDAYHRRIGVDAEQRRGDGQRRASHRQGG
ncbi:MAG: CAP domain-containing protein [Caldilineaceae bacterium]